VFLDVAGLTDRGRVRARNADQFLIAELNKSVAIRSSTLPIERQKRLAAATAGHLLVVADGWNNGGPADHASDVAIITSVEYVLALLPWFFDAVRGRDDAAVKLTNMVERAAVPLRHDANGRPALATSEATITMAFVIWPALFAVHCGSSRLYLLRGDELHHLTADGSTDYPRFRDATSVARLSGEPSRGNGSGSMIRMPTGVQMHVHQATIAYGDTILLCTDGLTAALSDEELSMMLREERPADSASLRLIHAANDAGGVDNTSVIVARALEHE
jgi:serine/threonine protein phosphatase PrpC